MTSRCLGVLPRQVDSGHEFTRKRLVEMESTLERKIADTNDDSSKVRAWGLGWYVLDKIPERMKLGKD